MRVRADLLAGRPVGVPAQALVQRHVGEVVHLEARARTGPPASAHSRTVVGPQVGVVDDHVRVGPQQRLDHGPLDAP